MKVKVRHSELKEEKKVGGYLICIFVVVGIIDALILFWPPIKAAQQDPSLWYSYRAYALWAWKTGYRAYEVIALLFLVFAAAGLVILGDLWLNKKVTQISTREVRRYYVKGTVVARSITGDTTGMCSTTERHYELSVELDNVGQQIIEVAGLDHYRATKAEGDKVTIEVEEKIGRNGRVLERKFLQTKRLKTTPAKTSEVEADNAVKTPT